MIEPKYDSQGQFGLFSRVRGAKQSERERVDRQIAKSMGVFKVATVSPFTVYMDGYPTPVAAKYIAGLTYTVGTTGIYLHRQGGKPTCFPTGE